MKPRALSPLLLLVCSPAVSFIFSPACSPRSRGEFGREPGAQTATSGAAAHHPRRPEEGGALNGAQRRGKKRRRAGAVEESTRSPRVPPTSRAPLSWTPPTDAVSCLQNPKTGSTVWLVGIVHQAAPYAELVKKTIREIRPQVVMLELHADSVFLLPAGKAEQSSDGMWWWKPNPQRPGGALRNKRGKQQRRKWPKSPRSPAEDGSSRTGGVDEIWTAGSEAQACGARVLLGDRDPEVSRRREAEADRADSAMLREISRAPPGGERERLERAGKGLQMLTEIIERRRQSGFERPETREIVRKHSELHRLLGPRAFGVVVTERDEVMARNLMALEGNRTTVAVVGSAHLDGMEDVLSANGWVMDRAETNGGAPERLAEP